MLLLGVSISATAQGREWPEWLPRALIHGRVVDADQQPLGDVEVFLVTFEDVWCSGWYAPRIEVGRWYPRGRRVKTPADGRYHFSVHVPEADDICVYVRGSIHKSVANRKLGLARDADQPPLLEGDHRIPTIELTDAGAVVGVVLDERRTATVDAEVRTNMGWRNGPFGGCVTQADGCYVLAHLPPGPAQLLLEGVDLRAPSLAHDLEVIAGQTITGPTIELDRSSASSGYVVDTGGRPVPDLRIELHPYRSGRFIIVQADRAGRFHFFLEHDGSHSLRLEHDSRFRRPRGDSGPWVFDAGSNDIRLVVERVPRMTIRVVDDASGHPIQRCRTWTGWNNTVDTGGYQAPRRAQGLAGVDADPAKREGVWIEAPGYAPFFGQLSDLPAVNDGVPTIRLLAGATITGRVVLAGEPVENAQVVIDLAVLGDDGEVLVDPTEEEYFEARRNVRRQAWRGIVRRTDSAGRFTIDGLSAAAYRLEVDSESGAPLLIDEARVELGETLDLGDVVLSEGCTLHVQLKLGDGVSAAGLRYSADLPWPGSMSQPLHGMFRDKRGRIESTDDSFTVHGLAEGVIVLRIEADGRRLVKPIERELVLVAGEPNHLVIDLSAQRTGSVEVLHVANRPVPAARVFVVPVDEAGDHLPGEPPLNLAVVDGRARGSVRSDRWHIAAAMNEHFLLGKSTPFRADPHADVTSVEIDAWLGELHLQFPDDFEIAESATFSVRLRREGSGPLTLSEVGGVYWSQNELFLGYSSINGRAGGGDWYDDRVLWSGPTVEFGALEEGRYEFSLRAGPADWYEVPDFLEHSWIEIRTGKVTVVEIGD